MKKITSIITICAVLFSTNFIYANNKQNDLNEKLNENKQEQITLESKIKDLDSKIEEIEKNIDDTNGKVETLDSEINITKLEIEDLENNIGENEESLGKRLKAINDNYSMGYIKVILSSTSLSDFFNNIYIVKQVVEQDKEILKELDNNKAEVENKEKDLTDKKQIQEELNVSLQQNNEIIQDDKSELEDLKNKLETEEDVLESEIEKLAAESAAKQSSENGASSDDTLSGEIISSVSWPVPGYSRVSSPYGYRLHPILNVQKMHTGIDIPAPTGTPTVSVDNGKIIYSGVQNGYGNTVMIQHDDGKVSLYAHNSELLVSVGQIVQKGQVVAKVGSTGRSTGPHLHFEIRINGKHTNPVPYIK